MKAQILNSKVGKKYRIQTLGCKANLFDSHLIEGQLQENGWERSGGDGAVDLLIINSCAVTHEAEKESWRIARRLKRSAPDAKLVFTGCAAEIGSAPNDEVKATRIGNRQKPDFIGSLSGETGKAPHPDDIAWPKIGLGDGAKGFSVAPFIENQTRPFLRVQEGCESFCTFCVIPYGRGPSRSVRPKEVIDAVQAFCDAGAKELVLTGTNLGDYGVEWAPKGKALDELIAMILKETSLSRLRLSSLDPTEISDRMLDWAENEPRFCPHFHVSLQSPVTSVLRKMKRRYQSEAAGEKLRKISELNRFVFVGMDVITGFPGETEADFRESVELLEKWPWTRMHVFPYSERRETPATRIPGKVPVEERRRRCRELNRLSLERQKQAYEGRLSDCHREILLEPSDRKGRVGRIWGYTPDYFRFEVAGGPKGLAETPELIEATPCEVVLRPEANDVFYRAQIESA